MRCLALRARPEGRSQELRVTVIYKLFEPNFGDLTLFEPNFVCVCLLFGGYMQIFQVRSDPPYQFSVLAENPFIGRLVL